MKSEKIGNIRTTNTKKITDIKNKEFQKNM